MLLLRGDAEAARHIARQARAEDEPAEGSGPVLACAVCAQEVTRRSAAIEVDGAHEHAFTNPAGIRFRIGCFARVVGCEESGVPTHEHTWFAGYAWRVEACAACGEHLGWSFRGTADGFHGLILDRLVEVDERA